MSPTRWRRSPLLLVLALLAFDLLLSQRPQAHEVPATIEVTAYFWTGPTRADLLLRVPLSGLLNSHLPKEGPGYLALDYVGPALTETAHALAEAIDFYQGDVRLGSPEVRAARISLPLDRAFDSYASALSLVNGPPLPPGTQVFWQQGFADFWLSYALPSAGAGPLSARFRLTPLAPTVTTSLHVAESYGAWADYRFDNDVGRIWFEPSAMRAARTFGTFGFGHAASQPRLLLFLVCLALAVPPWLGFGRSAAAAAAAMLVALLTLTLTGASASEWWVACLDFLLGAAILVAALQNVGRSDGAARFWVSGAAGVLLGARLAIDVAPLLQYAGAHVPSATTAFGGGVAAASLLVLAVALLVNLLLARIWPDTVVRVTAVSALIALLAWRDVLEQAGRVRYLDWSSLDRGTAESVLTWMLAAVAAAAAAWLAAGLVAEPRRTA